MNAFAFGTQDMEAAVVEGSGTETGHIITTTIGGKNGQPKQVTRDPSIPQPIDFGIPVSCQSSFS